MKFEKVTRFNQDYWFSGIYKLVSYQYYRGAQVPTYWVAYYIECGEHNWGTSVNKVDKMRSFDAVKDDCLKHAATYQPTNSQLKRAKIAQEKWGN